MKSTLLASIFGVALSSMGLMAEEPALDQPFMLKTTFGDTYHNCRVLKVTPETVTIMHELGVTKIGLELLSPDLQKKLQYDPVKAREFAKAEATKRESEAAHQRELKAKRDQEQRALMSDLAAREKAEVEAEAKRAREHAEALKLATAPAATGGTAPVMQTEVVVPAMAPITQVYSPGANRSRTFTTRDGITYYGDGAAYSPWYGGYPYVYGYPVVRPAPPCPPLAPQPRSSGISGSIKVGNGVIRINR